MAGIFSFKCSSCDEIHEGSPSFGYRFPDHYASLSDEQRASENVRAESEFCQINDDYFIRVCLDIPIVGVENPFVWGVWISLSKENFFSYWDAFNEPDASETYFGWLCNRLSFYPETRGLKTMATTLTDGNRPTLSVEETDHPLAIDFRYGITIARAQEIAEVTMHGAKT